MYATRAFDENDMKKAVKIRVKIRELENMLMALPMSRERSMAITKLDEALMWAGAAIAAVPTDEPPWDAEEDDRK